MGVISLYSAGQHVADFELASLGFSDGGGRYLELVGSSPVPALSWPPATTEDGDRAEQSVTLSQLRLKIEDPQASVEYELGTGNLVNSGGGLLTYTFLISVDYIRQALDL